MQEETSQTEPETITIATWEFEINGAFIEKPMPEIQQCPAATTWGDVLGSAGWEDSINLRSGSQVVEVKVFRKERTPEFLIDLWDFDRGLGLIYCRNLPTLLEFFRKYESFLSLGRHQEFNEAISNVNRYLFDRRDGLAAVKRVEAREEEAEYRRRYARQAQADQETSN